MKKRSIIWGLVLLACLGLGIFLFFWQQMPTRDNGVSDKDIAETVKRLRGGTEFPAPATVTPIDLKQPIHLAIGGLGCGDDERNRQLEDLVLTDLTGAPGLELVERQSLEAVLHELNMGLSGLVRARDAVRVGKLLKADWFLLGTGVNISGTNFIVIRLVDSHTGIMREAAVFSTGGSPVKLAADIAKFVQRCRQDAAVPKPRIFLSIGTFRDLSLNSRQAAFPRQLRAYLTAAYQGTNVTLLEREAADVLFHEVRLDLAGLTEGGGANPPEPLLSAYWFVDGDYQSYETTNFEVEVALKINRMFGRISMETLRGPPDKRLFDKIKNVIDTKMGRDTSPILLSLANEADAQMSAGKNLFGLGGWELGLVYQAYYYQETDAPEAARRRRNDEEAIHAFETVLLLQPTNREAKLCLAACLRKPTIGRTVEARDYYREILEEPMQDKWSALAQQALVETFRYADPEETLRWFRSATAQTTNAVAATFYNKQAEVAATTVTINAGDSAKAEELAEQRLFDAIQSFKNVIQGKSGIYRNDLGMDDYVKTFGSDRTTAAQKLVALLPKMESRVPDMEPYLLATVLTFQVDTNTPLVQEFQRTLDDCIEHPERVLKPEQFWDTIRWSVYRWCFEKTNYSLAVNLIEGERRAAAGGKVDFNDQEKIRLAYAYLGAQRWQDALDIFESFNNRPVQATANGPWGQGLTPVLTDKMAAFCRMKLGLAAVQDPRRFEMGGPLLCFCTPYSTPSTFIADDDGLWIGIGGRLLHLGFDLKTNLVINLPIDFTVPIRALCLTSSNIWIGTGGAGLIEFDKTSHQCRRLTEADGLMMDYLTSLTVAGDLLWIGYGGATGGGLGQLDLRSQKLKSFMPSLRVDASARASETPPRDGIGKIVAGADGDLWMSVANAIRQFHVSRDVWETLPNQFGNWLTCFSTDSERLVEGGGISLTEIEIETRPNRNAPTNEIKKTKLVVSSTELSRLEADLKTNGNYQYISSYSSGGIRPKGAVAIQNLRDHRWQKVEDADGLPNPPTTMTLDGNNLWVGGEGYIALVDLRECKVRKFCHIQAAGVDRIQIGGGYVWAQFNWRLYRAPIGDSQHEFLQSNFAKFVPVQFQKDANGAAVLQRLHVRENMFEHNGIYYCGFKFTLPPWFDGNFRLIYILAKSEAEKDLSVNYMNSNIIPENGPSAGSYDFLRESLASYPQLQTQFPYTGKMTTQNFDMKQLEPGKTYGIWFEFDAKSMPDIAFAMTVNSQRGTNEFGILPLR